MAWSIVLFFILILNFDILLVKLIVWFDEVFKRGIPWSKMSCLDKKIKRKLKFTIFKKIFQIINIMEFEIH